jgi:Zn/Cd-binding protein ZinT
LITRIIAADYQGGWVEEYRLLEDGTVEKIYYEGGSPEAERIREEARSGH